MSPRRRYSDTFTAGACSRIVLELPWDIGVPAGFVLPTWDEDADAARPSQPIYEAIGMGAPPTRRHGVSGWAEFKTVAVPVQLPLAASDLAFGDTRPDITDRKARRRLRQNVRKQIAQNGKQTRTVALVHVVVDTIGDAHDDGQAFYRALELLNAGLVSLGVSFDMRL